jgi:lipid-A-disaccharide synthase
MNKKFNDFTFIFHATDENKDLIKNKINSEKLNNVDVVSDENIKSQILEKSVFAVSKSGTVSLEICKAKIPSIIIYKMNFLNYLIVKMLIKVKYANIINIINDKEIIPELIQNECNSREVYNSVIYFLKNPDLMKKQVNHCQKTLNSLENGLSSENTANILLGYIKN